MLGNLAVIKCKDRESSSRVSLSLNPGCDCSAHNWPRLVTAWISRR
jgi:hypothetical protein